jgi:hypothetical protein
LARNASGIYSLPSAVNPVVTRTVITTDWANTTLTDLKTEITNSLDRTGRGAMTAPLQINAGTAALPGLTIDGDTNSGMYGAAADSLGFSTGGTLRLTIASALLTAAVPVGAADGAVGAPGLTFSADLDCGLYRAGANDVRLAIGGALRAQFDTKTSLAAATAATGGTRQDALSLTNGDLDLSAVTAPTSTTAISNRLTAANIPKAWVVFEIVGGGSPYTVSVQGGFNITSVARSSATLFVITFASSFASATGFGPVGQVLNGLNGADQYLFNPTTRATGSQTAGISSAGGGSVNLDTTGVTFQVMVVFYGAQ